MDAYMIAVLITGGGVLGVVVWVLAKVGKALIQIAEALAAAVVVFLAVWLMIKAVLWALRQVITRWRTSLTVLVATGGGIAGVGCRWPSPEPWLRRCSPGGGWSTWRHSIRGQVGMCGPGGCAGRCMRQSCRSGCMPAG